MIRPRAMPISPSRTDKEIEVWTAAGMARKFLFPVYPAMSTLLPMESPTERQMKRAMSSPLMPTAASALASAKRPTTAVSAALKSCCSMPVRAMGMAKRIIFFTNGPSVICIASCFIAVSLLALFIIALLFEFEKRMFLMYSMRKTNEKRMESRDKKSEE